MRRASGAIRFGLALVLLQSGAAGIARAGAQAAATPTPAPPPAAKQGDGVVATILNHPITTDQLMKPLLEAHGLTVLMNVVQLELAKDAAEKARVTVTDEDFTQERKQTLERLFRDGDEKTQGRIDNAIRKGNKEEAARLQKEMDRDHEQLFDQFLENQRVTKPEFELVLKTNTYLRKIAEPQIDAVITDKELRQAFEVEYGASVQVRHIQATTPADLTRALARVRPKDQGGGGEAFEDVAREVSTNPRTRALGGELPKFSMANAALPENFKQAAFALQEGEISNIVEAEGAFHIIKLEKRFAPQAVKFENVKEIVRRTLKDRLIQVAVKQSRAKLAEMARKELKISEPTLAAQFADRLADRDKQIHDQAEIRRQIEKERERDAQPGLPSTGDGAPPASAPDLAIPPAGQAPPAAPAPASAPPAPRATGAAAPPQAKKNDGPIKPGIVVQIPSRAPAPAAPADPARATGPAQGTQSAPAGK